MKRVVLMTFGLGGNTAYYAPEKTEHGTSECRGEWYLGPDQLQRHVGEHYPLEEIRGAVLVNLIPAIMQNPVFVFASPMFKPTLADDETDRFRDHEGSIVTDMIADEMTKHSAPLAVSYRLAKDCPEFTGMDFVGLGIYVAWWRERGAVIGHVDDNGTVCWAEEGEPND